MSSPVSGTEGYAEQAGELFRRYEAIPAEVAHAAVLHLIPRKPCCVLDIGAGTGRDAAWLAGMGHRVVAAEPTDAMRIGAMALHPSDRIEWLDDSLPELAALRARAATFDLVMLNAVWMHLDVAQRRRAMPNVTALLSRSGSLIMTLRHGPVPPGRRMFDVSADETIELAGLCGLAPVLNMWTGSNSQENRRAGVTWNTLAFMRNAAAGN